MSDADVVSLALCVLLGVTEPETVTLALAVPLWLLVPVLLGVCVLEGVSVSDAENVWLPVIVDVELGV